MLIEGLNAVNSASPGPGVRARLDRPSPVSGRILALKLRQRATEETSMKTATAALLGLMLNGCAAPEHPWDVPQPLPDGGQITYLKIAIYEYPTPLQVINRCRPRGLPQMAIGPGCAKVSGDLQRIYVLHVPRGEQRVGKYYDVLALWGHELWHLAGGRH